MPPPLKSSVESRFIPKASSAALRASAARVGHTRDCPLLLAADAVVLDIGCGRGCAVDDSCEYRRNIRDLRGERRRVIGIDIDPAGQTNPGLDEFRIIAEAERWPVDTATIDMAYGDFVAEHLERPDDFFAELRRVLKPGGYVGLRTPNSSSYIAVLSRLIPNRFHAKATHFAQAGRKAEDVFPTYYRCNTRRKLTRMFHKHGFYSCVYSVEGEPSYLRFSRLAYRIGAVVHRYIPQTFQSTLVAFAQKLS